MKKYLFLFALVLVSTTIALILAKRTANENEFIAYRADLAKQDLKFYWKDDKGQLLNSIGRLKAWLQSKGQRLFFACNAGMFKKDRSPQGLFIENRQTKMPLDTSTAAGNFYLKPNGVFYITAGNKAVICKTEDFWYSDNVLYATQSGPMLITEGVVNPAFRQGSANVNIRNGVGILPDGKPIFAMSKQKLCFYEFADYFKKLGCRNALYLDGFVSRTYLPESDWIQLDGNFGVMIGAVKKE